jgi:[protein-PII] uridylyltransferase
MLREEDFGFAAYIASMPPDYRAAFDLDAARAHEEIVRRREGRKTHVEIWRELSAHVVAICVVADDKPGLLSSISAALVASKIDVVKAHAYCRRREDGSAEAVDLLWIRRLPTPAGVTPPMRAKDILALAEAIKIAAAAGVSMEDGPFGPHDPPSEAQPVWGAGPSARPPSSWARRSGASARVRFETDRDGATVLTIEAVDRPGLLLAVTQSLFRAGLQIVGLHATTENGSAVDRFTLAEVDGSTLRNERLLTLQTAILGAIEEGTFARRSAG